MHEQFLLPAQSEVLNPENYRNKPLPLRTALPDHLSKIQIKSIQFENFNEDPDSQDENILVYRKLYSRADKPKMSIEKVLSTANLSSAAAQGKTLEQILKVHEQSSLLEIFRQYISLHSSESPILHTTYDQKEARVSRGAIITFSLPKRWLLEHRSEIFTGLKTEKEIAFLYSLPWDFVKSISIVNGLNEETYSWDERVYSKDELLRMRS